MAVRNWFALKAQGHKANQKTLSATSAAYTARVGSTTDRFAYDYPIEVENPTDNFTITVPDGYYIGQELLITLNGNTNSKTVTVTTTTGTDYTLATTGMWILMMWTGTVSGWLKVAGTTST